MFHRHMNPGRKMARKMKPTIKPMNPAGEISGLRILFTASVALTATAAGIALLPRQ